ncbi:MAG: hypothetical protein COA99_09740 [Moraxellaceae bacterium]|nr:MAG: hypothetical protein COA99_09740 [Moraxellaceae bacterium]
MEYMDCPRCTSLLVDGEYENEEAKFCKGCSGVLIKQRSLQKILAKLSHDLYSSIDINMVLPPVSDSGALGSCPECGAHMDHYGYMESNKVMIDCCDSCNSLWLDPLELVAMTKMYVQSNKMRQRLRATEYRGADLGTAQAYSELLSRSFLLGFTIR